MMKIVSFLIALLFGFSFFPAGRLPAGPPPPGGQPAAAAPFRVSLPLVQRPSLFDVAHISPNIGRTLGVVQDPFDQAVLYAYTFGSGVYKSSDAGQTWRPSSKGLGNLVIQSLTAHPAVPGVLYAGTYGDASAPYSGVYKSTDFGETWAATGEMANTWNGVVYKTPVVYALAVDPHNPNLLYAGTRMKDLPPYQLGGGGVFRSENGGASWTPVNAGLPNDKLYVYDLILNPSQPGQIFATLHGIPPGGIYVSNNGGASWTPWFLRDGALDGRALLLDPFDSTVLFYGAATNSGVWRYAVQDGWRRVFANWSANIGALSADPYHPNRIYAGVSQQIPGDDGFTYRLMRSTDGGGSWDVSESFNTSYPLAFSPNGRSLFAAVDFNGIWRSDDEGLSWVESSRGLTGFSAAGFDTGRADPNRMAVALYGEGVKVSTDGGRTWDNRMKGLETPNVTALAMDPADPNVIYVTTYMSGVYRTQNFGASWTALTAGYPYPAAGLQDAPSAPWNPLEDRPLPERDGDLRAPGGPDAAAQEVTGLVSGSALAISPADGRIVLVGTRGRGVLRLVDGVWTPTGLAAGSVYSLQFDLSAPGRVLAGSDAPSGGVQISADSGQTWTPGGLAGRRVNALAQSPDNPAVWLAGTDAGLYASTNGGTSWTPAGLNGQDVRGAAVMRGGQQRPAYFAATAAAVYASAALPGAWGPVSPALNDLGVQHLLRAYDGQSVFVISRLGGVKQVR